jgi:hypothetical protein
LILSKIIFEFGIRKINVLLSTLGIHESLGDSVEQFNGQDHISGAPAEEWSHHATGISSGKSGLPQIGGKKITMWRYPARRSFLRNWKLKGLVPNFLGALGPSAYVGRRMLTKRCTWAIGIPVAEILPDARMAYG